VTRDTNRRAVTAAGLLTAVVVVLLAAWFVSGWRDVRMRQAEIQKAPYTAADQRARELARELRTELDALLAREVRRPYFHYQNLMHDPQTTAGVNVSRSPLASGSEEKLVLGYFQLDAKRRTTTPTLNDNVPELSTRDRLADHRAFRDQVARDLARPLAPGQQPGGQVAASRQSPSRTQAKTPESQVIQQDPRVYVQNANPNAVYAQQTQTLKGPDVPVTITISPLEWRTMSFAGAPTLIAIRHVQTPDGPLTQGFVVDHRAVTTWLGGRAADVIPVWRADDTLSASVVPEWGLTLQPAPDSISRAAEESDAAAKEFLIRFSGLGTVAVVAAAFVMLLVARSEKLARERSEFAAAAAHELRTPLAGLQLYGDMLAEGLGDPGKMREYARRMSEDAARLGRVVSNILGVSQLERGSLAIDAQVGQLSEVLGEIGERARPALDRVGATLELNVPCDLCARFDRDALTRIVGNLLDNAEKYTRQADDRTIRLAAADRGDSIEVSVADRGSGVSDHSRLFHSFSRGTSGRDAPAGLGLGLALSRSLARAMGGDLTYRPRDGGGATFLLQLRRE
jgi:signal transduction histidine kinase